MLSETDQKIIPTIGRTLIVMGKVFSVFILSILFGIFGFAFFATVGTNSLPYIQIGGSFGYEAYGMIGFSIGTVLGAILGVFVINKGKVVIWSGVFGGVLLFGILGWGPTGIVVGPLVGLSAWLLPSAFVIYSSAMLVRK